jgi:hypothetical protein
VTRIAIIGDVHDQRERLARLLRAIEQAPPDLAVLVGDLGLDPRRDPSGEGWVREEHDASVRAVVATVGGRLGCPVLFVPGNHDLRDPDPATPGINCDGTVVECAGLRVAGLGGAGPHRFGFPYEWSEQEAHEALSRLDDGAAIDLFVCHTPPAETGLDRVWRGPRVGSRAVRRWIADRRPTLAVFGHIHEALGVECVEGVTCLNAGALGEPFPEEVIWTVELSSSRVEIVRSHRPAADGFEIREWAS